MADRTQHEGKTEHAKESHDRCSQPPGMGVLKTTDLGTQALLVVNSFKLHLTAFSGSGTSSSQSAPLLLKDNLSYQDERSEHTERIKCGADSGEDASFSQGLVLQLYSKLQGIRLHTPLDTKSTFNREGIFGDIQVFERIGSEGKPLGKILSLSKGEGELDDLMFQIESICERRYLCN